MQLVSQAVGGFAPTANEAQHVIGELVHIAVRGGALDEGEGVIHVCLVRGGGGAVPEAVVHSGGKQRCGRCGRRIRLGGGGVVWLAQVVEMNVDRAKVGRSAVKVERNLVRGALVLRLLLRGLRRCH